MPEIVIGSGRVTNYALAGRADAPVLVLVAGLDSPGSVWAPTVEALSGALRVLTLDNRDAGANAPEAESYTLDELADDVLDLLTALGIERAHVLGHSLGGYIAQNIAMRHPQRVDKLLLISTGPTARGALGLPPPTIADHDWIEDPVERFRAGLSEGVAPRFRDEHGRELDEIAALARGNRCTHDGYDRQSAAVYDYDVRRTLDAITAPTLVLAGDLDYFGPKAATILGERIPNAQLLRYAGVGHMPMFEAPDRFHADILRFLDTDDAARPGQMVPSR
jgi:3-oxoadipate enol-lactonase